MSPIPRPTKFNAKVSCYVTSIFHNDQASCTMTTLLHKSQIGLYDLAMDNQIKNLQNIERLHLM